ncbi:MAG: hypothetical protein ACI906_002159 [Candidatus Latescibacterota bacterium]|jgi:hypothetical protein
MYRALLLLSIFCVSLNAQEGYRLLLDRVEVNSQAQWSVWQAPIGTRVLEADGSVLPRFLRRDINAALNADTFIYVSEGDTLTGGIHSAGSNLEQAHLVIDGDETTYWEPELDRPVGDWWLDIDLGRVAILKRIVVRFAAEGVGDPLLKFRVLISDGRVTFTYVRKRGFTRVGLVNYPNKTQREFVFDLEPPARAPLGMEGVAAQIVRIEALESAGLRGTAVDSAGYGEMPETDRGAIDYFRRTVAGRQIPVNAEVYLALPQEEQGDVRYYRRERPRLAEVEVYALGDNAVRLTRPSLEEMARDATARSQRSYTDGLFSTFINMREYDPRRDEHQLVIDLGAQYWLERIRLLSPEEPPPAYQLRVSDGSLNPEGERIWRLFDERLNRESFLQLEENFSLRQVRYIDLRRLQLPAARSERGQLSEIQAYGEGYVSEVVMTSPLIKLPRPALFTHVSWQGEIPRNTQIAVRTRTGNELEEILHYYSDRDNEITREAWQRRDEDRRGPVVLEELPGADWSNWSETYFASGEIFKSPSPRRYALAELRLQSSEPLRAASIRSLQLHFAPPLVDTAVAELWPLRQIEPGQDEEFTLYIHPTFGADNPGFDRLLLRSSSAVPIEILEVRAGTENLLRLGAGQVLWPGPLQLTRGDEGAAELQFPAPVRRSTLYAIRLRTRVFLGNTQFSAQLLNTALPARAQQISAGNATDLVASQSLVAVADLNASGLLEEVEIEPPVFTPNGDGINDELSIAAKVFAVESGRGLRLEIFDLSGRLLRDLSQERLRPSGEYTVRWDGRDEHHRLVPPGTYLLRLKLETDADRSGRETVRVVQVAY